MAVTTRSDESSWWQRSYESSWWVGFYAVLKESKGLVWKYFNFELDESGQPFNRIVCWPAPHGPKWVQTAPRCPMNIDILYRYAYSISCKIQIELLLPIYMTTNYTHCVHTLPNGIPNNVGTAQLQLHSSNSLSWCSEDLVADTPLVSFNHFLVLMPLMRGKYCVRLQCCVFGSHRLCPRFN